MSPIIDNLIFDFGFHDGSDSEFYIKKGFRVVSIEADPELCEIANRKYKEYIESGMLTILNIGIAAFKGYSTFYKNLDNSEWSSFDPKLGTRDGTKYVEIQVETTSPDEIFSEYGVPYYVKVDIEGFDRYVLNAVDKLTTKPHFLSVEDSGIDTLVELRHSGAKQFLFVDQTRLWETNLPNPPLEGVYVDWKFKTCCSGSFGKELVGNWLNVYQAFEYYVDHVRPNGLLPGRRWWDIHVTF